MRLWTLALALGLPTLAGCVPLTGDGRYDPRVYDANGNPAMPAGTAPPECRQIAQTVEIDGKRQQAFATVCQQPDGGWHFTD